MSAKLISIVIGAILVLSTGTLVYVKKEPVYVPTDTSSTVSTPTTPKNSTTTTTSNKEYYGEKEGDDDEDDGGTTTPVVTPTPKPVTTTPAPSAPSGVTLAQVATHSSRSSCWSAINGSVYDLTSWIPNHPGGEQTILSLCGINGSAGYNNQHGGSSKPANILFGFKVGTLAK